MENLTEIKLETERNKLFKPPVSTSDPFYSIAESEYDKAKEKEMKDIRAEIKRTSLQSTLV